MKGINKKYLLLLTTMCIFMLAQNIGYSYVYSGKHWPDPANPEMDPMGEPYLINPNCSDEDAGTPEQQIAAIQAGARAWNNEGNANFSFTYGGTTTKELPDDGGMGATPDGENQIMFVNDPTYYLFADNPGIIAVTIGWSVEVEPGHSHITERDLAFNDVHMNFSTKTIPIAADHEIDVWNVAAHELGHFLNLGHTSDSSTTMYGNITYGETKKRDLAVDDINGIQFIYGATDNVNPVLSNGSVSPATGSDQTPFGFYVDYFDADGDAPTAAKIFIDGTAHDMTYLSGLPHNGRYYYTTQLETIPLPTAPSFKLLHQLQQEFINENSPQVIIKYRRALLTMPHHYYFVFEDGQGGSDILPVVENPAAADPYAGPRVFKSIPQPGNIIPDKPPTE